MRLSIRFAILKPRINDSKLSLKVIHKQTLGLFESMKQIDHRCRECTADAGSDDVDERILCHEKTLSFTQSMFRGPGTSMSDRPIMTVHECDSIWLIALGST